jgi:creatinine amidohydrolase
MATMADKTPFSLPSRFWAELTARFRTTAGQPLAAQTVAVLPVAAIEQHGPHLPLRSMPRCSKA